MTNKEQIRLLRVALQKCAGALACMADSHTIDRRTPFAFKGEWEHLGSPTVQEMLEEASSALEVSQ